MILDEHVKTLPQQILQLDLSLCVMLTKEGIKNLPINLRVLKLVGVKDSCFVDYSTFTQLEELDISFSFPARGKNFDLKLPPNLQELSMGDINPSLHDLNYMIEILPASLKILNCKSLSMERSAKIASEILENLAKKYPLLQIIKQNPRNMVTEELISTELTYIYNLVDFINYSMQQKLYYYYMQYTSISNHINFNLNIHI